MKKNILSQFSILLLILFFMEIYTAVLAQEQEIPQLEIPLITTTTILVCNDSNEDDYFTETAQELDVPLITYEKTMELGDILIEMFGTGGE